jgi:hypothetical protein
VVEEAADMKRLKLTHGYHDALVRAIRYRDNADVILDVDLCSCCNPSLGRATLSFLGLRNFAGVHAALEAARHANAKRDYIDEIVGIVRHEGRGYVLNLMTAGAMHADARGLHEA